MSLGITKMKWTIYVPIKKKLGHVQLIQHSATLRQLFVNFCSNKKRWFVNFLWNQSEDSSFLSISCSGALSYLRFPVLKKICSLHSSLYYWKFLYAWLNIHILMICIELLVCNRRTVKNIPKYASPQFWIDNVPPSMKERKIMSINPFLSGLG
jgi:hypothetical protein